jgi:MarR family multiple antibiotic resistance transcriptional regulator
MDAFDHLVRTETVLWNLLESRLRSRGRAGLGSLQALRVLSRHEGRGRVEDVRRALAITNGAASRLIDRMERRGLVERIPNPEDRRSSCIVLTAAGEAEVADAEAHLGALVDDVIGEDDAAALIPLLERIEHRVGTYEEPRA